MAHGVFDDYTETDSAIFVVLRSIAKAHIHGFAPLGCVDRYWAGHLKRNPSCTGKIMTRWGEKVPSNMELLTRWRVLAEPGVEPATADLQSLGKDGAEDAVKQWEFLRDYVVADKDRKPQESDKAPLP